MVNEAGFIWKTSIEMNGKANGELSPVSKMVYLQKKKKKLLKQRSYCMYAYVSAIQLASKLYWFNNTDLKASL